MYILSCHVPFLYASEKAIILNLGTSLTLIMEMLDVDNGDEELNSTPFCHLVQLGLFTWGHRKIRIQGLC